MADISSKSLKIKTVSSLQKILPIPDSDAPEFSNGSCLIGERFSYQIAYMGDSDFHCAARMDIKINSDIADRIIVYDVECVPVTMAAYQDEFDKIQSEYKKVKKSKKKSSSSSKKTSHPLSYYIRK